MKIALQVRCLFFAIVLLTSCDKKEEVVEPELAVVVDANFTDVPLNSGFEKRCDAQFIFTENPLSISSVPPRHNLTKKYYRANFNGELNQNAQNANALVMPIIGSKINGMAMCTNDGLGCDDTIESTLWYDFGELSAKRELTWEYTVATGGKGKKARVSMTELPQPATLHNLPAEFSVNSDYTLDFSRHSEKDSITFQLVFIPKSQITEPIDNEFISYATTVLATKPGTNSYTIKGSSIEAIKKHFNVSAATDSLFFCVRTDRNVIKNIDDKKVIVTYRINDLTPVKF